MLLGSEGRGRGVARAGKLADLHTGAEAPLDAVAEQKTVVVVHADGPTVYGTLEAVDAGKGTLTVLVGAGRGSDGEKRTFTLAKKGEVFRDGREIGLGELKPRRRRPGQRQTVAGSEAGQDRHRGQATRVVP